MPNGPTTPAAGSLSAVSIGEKTSPVGSIEASAAIRSAQATARVPRCERRPSPCRRAATRPRRRHDRPSDRPRRRSRPRRRTATVASPRWPRTRRWRGRCRPAILRTPSGWRRRTSALGQAPTRPRMARSRRRELVGLERFEVEAAGCVGDDPPKLGDLMSKGVGGGEVLRGFGLGALPASRRPLRRPRLSRPSSDRVMRSLSPVAGTTLHRRGGRLGHPRHSAVGQAVATLVAPRRRAAIVSSVRIAMVGSTRRPRKTHSVRA